MIANNLRSPLLKFNLFFLADVLCSYYSCSRVSLKGTECWEIGSPKTPAFRQRLGVSMRPLLTSCLAVRKKINKTFNKWKEFILRLNRGRETNLQVVSCRLWSRGILITYSLLKGWQYIWHKCHLLLSCQSIVTQCMQCSARSVPSLSRSGKVLRVIS